MHGDSQYVQIDSNPQGARACIYNDCFITPAKVLLKRGLPLQEYTILLEKEGYKPGYATINQKPSVWLWGDILWGVIPGMAVDCITGGAFELYPKEISISLEESAK